MEEFNPIHLRTKKIIGIAVISIAVIVLIALAFLTLAPPKISGASPYSGENNVTIKAIITVDFDVPINRDQTELSISPSVLGNWQYENSFLGNHLYRKLVFTPESEFEPATQYTISIKHAGGFSNFGRYRDLSLQFTTQDADKPVVVAPVTAAPVPVVAEAPKSKPKTTFTTTAAPSPPPTPQVILSIAVDYQDKALSCEAASLKMALSYKGAKVSEDDIMSIIGFDYTIRNGDVWGNPNNAFVGDINGKQDTTGYGVYWGPIARAANNWRSAEAFSGWSMSQLARELANDNPIVIWGTYGKSAYSDNWHTPAGTAITAWKGEHARTLIGFKGTVDNPTQFIINDPIAGRLTWSVSALSSNAAAFGVSGVVIR